ncbi:hypothetical protein XELAEV_18035757mg [Xenopus laevis]|uniref:Uncharacterized protein n=1 Tax=Xenopus laevis TaxID=8355 RepID=A0A974CG81_XENLA|nr:hypothetical protein XELAEV_18035757mg [Xenopus laevis]
MTLSCLKRDRRHPAPGQEHHWGSDCINHFAYEICLIQLSDRVRCSARLKNRSCSGAHSSSDHEADTYGPKKKAVSSKNTDKKSPKKLENDEKGLMESDEQEFINKTDNTASNESNAGHVNTCPSASPFSDLNEVSRNGLTDDSEDGVGFSHKTSSEPSKVREVYLNGSPFVDEDSNQPMPLGLFFENADLMQVRFP